MNFSGTENSMAVTNLFEYMHPPSTHIQQPNLSDYTVLYANNDLPVFYYQTDTRF